MSATSAKVLQKARAEALATMQAYRKKWNSAGSGHMNDDRLTLQAERSVVIADRLRQPGVVILNDPVGTGKTVVALAAARLLLEAWPVTAERVARVVIVAPNAELAAEWVRRGLDAGLNPRSAYGPVSQRSAPHQLMVVTSHDLAKPHAVHLPHKSTVLFIVDEAHRGLHDRNSDAYQSLAKKAKGARVLLVTATPFQMRPSGLEAMIEVGGDPHAGDRIRAYGAAVAAWLKACYDRDFPLDGLDVAKLDQATADAVQQVIAAREAAQEDLDRVFMPCYPRKEMGLPEDFVLPDEPDPVPIDDDWVVAYHAARLLPELLADLVDGSDARSVHNSDSYMRMLNSSLGAWRGAAVSRKAGELVAEAGTDPARRALGDFLEHLQDALGRDPLDHPKVRQTAMLAVSRAAAPQHVLVFCQFLETQADLHRAVQQLIDYEGFGGPQPSIQVAAPTDRAAARRIHQESFGRPPGADNPPVILIVSDKLSESVDLDGGEPVVIHHDLAWSPVRWTQRMGRVVRARTGFQELLESDVIVPVMPTRIDERLWETVKNRHALMRAAAGSDPQAWIDLQRAMSDTPD